MFKIFLKLFMTRLLALFSCISIYYGPNLTNFQENLTEFKSDNKDYIPNNQQQKCNKVDVSVIVIAPVIGIFNTKLFIFK